MEFIFHKEIISCLLFQNDPKALNLFDSVFGCFDFENLGKREGYGVFIWVDGEYYEGQFKANKPHGYGVYHYKNGDAYEGDFVNGVKHGEGVYHFNNGNVYRGGYEQGQ